MHVRKKGKTQREEKQDGRERDRGSECGGKEGERKSAESERVWGERESVERVWRERECVEREREHGERECVEREREHGE